MASGYLFDTDAAHTVPLVFLVAWGANPRGTAPLAGRPRISRSCTVVASIGLRELIVARAFEIAVVFPHEFPQ